MICNVHPAVHTFQFVVDVRQEFFVELSVAVFGTRQRRILL